MISLKDKIRFQMDSNQRHYHIKFKWLTILVKSKAHKILQPAYSISLNLCFNYKIKNNLTLSKAQIQIKIIIHLIPRKNLKAYCHNLTNNNSAKILNLFNKVII